MLDPERENELMQQFREGKRSALESIFYDYHSRLCYFADLIVKDQEIAKEIVSDRFVDLFNSRDRFISIYDVAGFLYLSAFDECLKRLRAVKGDFMLQSSEKGFHARVLSKRLQGLIHKGDGEELINFKEELIFYVETTWNYYLAHRTLPNEYKETLRDYMEDVPIEEISKRTGLTTAHLRIRQKNAMSLWKERLNGKDCTPFTGYN